MDVHPSWEDQDATAESRKQDHISLAFEAQQRMQKIDDRFYYEPLLRPHITDASVLVQNFVGKTMRLPLWVSSMTGGTEMAAKINHVLAKVCRTYGLGMGLGSCRSLLNSNERINDFAVRHIIGDQPLYANLGVAQLEQIAEQNAWGLVKELLNKLETDGLIIHVNPLQEWTQPEGDIYKKSPIETIKRTIDALNTSIIVKEVGQGFGPKSIEALLELPLSAIEMGASGGTNFALLELLRASRIAQDVLDPITHVGHTPLEMVGYLNELKESMGARCLVQDIIVSGGVKDFLDGYYYQETLNFNAVVGYASTFLKYALNGYDDLCAFIELQTKGLLAAKSYLVLK